MLVVYKAPDELSARSVLALLQQAGVPAVLRSFQISAYANLGSMLFPNWGEILVDELDFGRAAEQIDGFFGEPRAEAVPQAESQPRPAADTGRPETQEC
jgi:hypothetical protein